MVRNYNDNVRGAWRSGWVDTDGKIYHSNSPKGGRSAKRFTNESVGGIVTLTERNICMWGITLTTSDKIPMKTLRALSADKSVNWSLGATELSRKVEREPLYH